MNRNLNTWSTVSTVNGHGYDGQHKKKLFAMLVDRAELFEAHLSYRLLNFDLFVMLIILYKFYRCLHVVEICQF